MSPAAPPATDPSPPADDPSPQPSGAYPVLLRLAGRRLLVVGGGPVAAGKVARLRPTGARITVVAPEAVPAIAEDPSITWHRRPYQRGEAASYRLVITCTGDPEVDRQVGFDGEAAGVWVDSAGGDDVGSASLGAVARRGPVSVAVATDGQAPALATYLRDRFQTELDRGVEDLAALVAAARRDLRSRAGSAEHPAWREVLDGSPRGADRPDDLLALVRAGRRDEAEARLRQALDLLEGTARTTPDTSEEERP